MVYLVGREGEHSSGRRISDALAIDGTSAGTPDNDKLTGSDGPDTLDGGDGDDTINGGAGNDELTGGGGDDLLDGGEGHDSLDGGSGDDTLLGGAGSDTATVTGGTTSADTGTDIVDLAIGDDHLVVDYGTLTESVTYGITAPTLGSTGYSGAFEVGGQTRITYQGVDRITITTGSGNDVVSSLNNQDVISTGAGDDVVYAPAGGGPVQIDVGAGTDAVHGVDWSDMPHGIDIYLNDPNGVRAGGQLTPFRYIRGVESLIGFKATSFDDTIWLHDSGRYDYGITTGAGVDSVFVYGGATAATTGRVTLDLGSTTPDPQSADYLYVYFQAATEQIHYVQSGRDATLSLGGQAVHSYAGFTVLTLFGGTSDDIIDGRGSDGFTSFQVRSAGAGDDILYGGAQGDTLVGGTGDDTMRGGAGDDTYGVDSAADIVEELPGEGVDTVESSYGSSSDFTALYVLPDNVENLTGTKLSGQGVQGNALNNLISMGIGNDLIVLHDGGDDTVLGGGGNDFIYYGAAFTNGDSADGGAGTDTVGLLGTYTITFDENDLVSVEKLALYSSGNSSSPNTYGITTTEGTVAWSAQLTVAAQSLMAGESLVFDGSAETDGRFNILGGRGSDTIVGGAGNDKLRGGGGADLLTGGGGFDSFDYFSAADSAPGSRDTILDFTGGDRINLGGIDADGNAANGNSRFAFLGAAAFSGVAGQLRAYQDSGSPSSWTVEGDINGDSIADFAITAKVQPGYSLTQGDFWL